MDGVAYLIKKNYTKDEMGQLKPATEGQTEILVTENSVKRNEFFGAGRNGLIAEYVLTTASINYSGESEIIYNGMRYSIYRTYKVKNTDDIELYLKR